MADKSLQDLFNGLNTVVNTKTVVGEAIHVDGATIVPLIEVSFGMASGEFGRNAGENSTAGMGAKMAPTALLIVQNGSTRLMSIKSQDAVTKVMDMIPDLFNRVTGKKVSPEIVEKAKKIAADSETRRTAE